MRILHLNTHASGGSYECATLLSDALAGDGIDSCVLCKDAPAKGIRFFLNRLIRRASVSLSREPWHGTRRVLLAPEPAELADVDVVHLHTVADWFDVPRWLESLPTGIKIVISLHDMWHFTGGCFLYRGCDRYTGVCSPCPILKTPANRFLAADERARKLRSYRNCGARLVANSHWLADIAGRSPIAKACGGVRVIPSGIDTAVFRPQDKKQCRERLGVPMNAFVIATGSASLTDANKNVPWLLEQLSHLPALSSVVVLTFGDGTVPVPDDLDVRLTGGVRERRDLARLLAAADVFVSASLMETYGLTLVEAMACCTPVVAFRVGGIPEAAPDGRGAILCAPLDGAALIEAVTKLRDSKEARETLGNAGHEMARTRNGRRSFAEAFVRVYEECVGPAKTPSASGSVLTS
jgi:glycosyltransferase involved in cell wall biosynthesis